MTEAEWRPVAGYEGMYEVSDAGEVRGVDRYVRAGSGRRLIGGRVLAQATKKGYRVVHLTRDGRAEHSPVHVLVAEAFLGPRTGPHVRHLDGNSMHNRPANLAYGTVAENTADRVTHGTLVTPYAGRTHCSRNHEYTESNTRVRVRGDRTTRECRACERTKTRNRSPKQKAA